MNSNITFEDCVSIEDYIENKITVLKELYIFPYCSAEEIHELQSCTSEQVVDRIARTLLNKYYDAMIEDFEREPLIEIETPDLDAVLQSSLENKSKNALMRAHLPTFTEFMEYVTAYGWDSIKCFGAACAKDTFKYLMPDADEEEILMMVNQYKSHKI